MQIPIHFLKEGEEVDVKKHPGTQVRDVMEKVLKESRESQIFLLQDEILATTEFVLRKIQSTKPQKNLEACLVLGKKQALYFRDSRFTPDVYIPTGGTLLDQKGNIIGMNVEHYKPFEITNAIKMNELEERRKRVEICLDILNQEMIAYLEAWKKTGGGTKGHAIGSIKHRFLEFTKFFKNYC